MNNSNDILLARYWINQPSTLQPDHTNHGKLVLAFEDLRGDDYCTCYFTEGPVISQRINKQALSPGWPAHLTEPDAPEADFID